MTITKKTPLKFALSKSTSPIFRKYGVMKTSYYDEYITLQEFANQHSIELHDFITDLNDVRKTRANR